MKLFKKIDEIIAGLETGLITVILSLMIILSFGQVVLRNFFNESILWGDIFLRQMVLWVGFIGASLAARDQRHIAVDFLPNILPSSWGKHILILTNICAAGISGFLAQAAWDFVAYERKSESTLFFNYPVWFFQIVLPYGFSLLTLRFILCAINSTLSRRVESR